MYVCMYACMYVCLYVCMYVEWRPRPQCVRPIWEFPKIRGRIIDRKGLMMWTETRQIVDMMLLLFLHWGVLEKGV